MQPSRENKPACVYFCLTRGFNMAEVIVIDFKNYQDIVTNASKKYTHHLMTVRNISLLEKSTECSLQHHKRVISYSQTRQEAGKCALEGFED